MADYSDWELVDNSPSPAAPASPSMGKYAGWEAVQGAPTSMQPPSQNESLGMSAIKAPFRVGEDVYRGGMNFLKSLPGYAQAAKTQVPGLLETLQAHPGHALGQGVAGLAELGQNIFNSPHDLVNYMTNRLNLIPQSVNQKVQMARMPDSEGDINATFGQPQYAGEQLARGLGRNALNIVGGAGAANVLNPMNLTAKSIAKDVVNTEKQQVASHTARYNKIWDEADKSGFNQVPADLNLLSNNLSTIEKYKTPREYQSLEDFIINPTLQNAQKAQSDMGIMHRKLEEKSRSGALTSEEQALYQAAKNSENHIENHMFKNAAGNTNEKLQNKYQKLTKSYRQNVVPYKYNESIQAYKNQEMLPEELVNALSRGEFAAKKGSAHPAIGLRRNFKPYLTGAGLLGGGATLYDQMFGNKPPEQ